MNGGRTTTSRRWSFSLASLLFLTACLAGYLSGYQMGHREGLAEWNVLPLVTNTYPVSDITQNSVVERNSSLKTSDELVKLIKAEVLPVSWLESGGNGEIQAAVVSGSENLIVSANMIVHSKVRVLLDKMREDNNR